MLRTLYQVNISYLLIAVTLNIPLFFSKSYRWYCLLKQQAIQYSVLQSCLVYMSSLYVGFITPGRLGEFTKAIYLKLDKNISLSKGMSSVIVDRLLDMYLLIILGIVGAWQFGILGRLSSISLILMVIVFVAPLLMLHKQLMGKLVSFLYNVVVIKKMKDKIEEKFEDFYSGINQLINGKIIFLCGFNLLKLLNFFHSVLLNYISDWDLNRFFNDYSFYGYFQLD